MIIRCPHCEHTRSISEGKIPAQAEYATCPKCRHRFLFRSLPRDVEAESQPSSATASAAAIQARKQSGEDRHPPQPRTAGPEVLRPQEAFRESEEQRDIWDAMDALHQRWEAQLDQHVTEVEQPRPAKAGEAAETFFPPEPVPDGPEPAMAAPEQAAPPSRERTPLQTPPQTPPQAPPQAPSQTPGQPPLQTPGQPPSQAPGQPLLQASGQASSQAPGQASAQASDRPPSQPSAQRPGTGSSAGERRQAEAGNGESPGSKSSPDTEGEQRRPTGADDSPAERGAGNSTAEGGAGSDFAHAARPGTGTDTRSDARPGADSDARPATGPDDGPDDGPDSGPATGPDSGPDNGSVAASSSEQAARPRFPVYGEDGPDPEERVEKDMAMLRAASASGPMRDLGRLREFPDPAQAAEAGAAADDGQLLHLPGPEAVPDPGQAVETQTPAWEHLRGSRLAAFNATVRGVMFGGPGYFAGMSGSGSLVPGYLFFLLMGYICILCSLAWRGLAELLLPGLLPPFPRGLVLPALLLLAPAALGLMQLFVTGWMRLLLRLLVPDQADFGLVYKVVSYSVAPFVLSIVPFAGPLLGAAWFMASLSSGCRGALRLSLPLSILLPLPPALLLLTALAWYFL